MRRANALLPLLLLLALPAEAGKTVVVTLGRSPSSTTTSVANSEDMVRRLGVYRTLGMDFDLKQDQTIKTVWLRELIFPGVGGTGTQAYVASIVHEFGSSTNAQQLTSPCLPCSLTFQASWPTGGPMVLLSPDAHPGINMLEDAASPACTTGFQANAAGVSVKFQVNRFAPGTSYHWRAYNIFDGYRRQASNPPAAGVWRPLVRESRNGWNPYAQQSLAPANWDSLPEGAETSDTVGTVARYKKNGAGPPIVIAGLGTGGFALHDYGTLLTTLAFADSAAGRAILGQTRDLPVRFTIQVGPLAATGKYNALSAAGLDEGVGPYPGDSVYVKATMVAWQAMGLKVVYLVQTNRDSMAAFANQLEWIRLLHPLAHVAPFDKAGVWTGQVGGGNSTTTKINDVMGATRDRSLFPAACSDPRLGCNCTSDTTSVTCGLKRQFAALTAYFGASRVDHVIACPLEDWSPLYFTRARGSLDSLKWCLYLAGVRGVRVGNYSLTNDAGTATGAANPRGYKSGFSVEDVRDPASGQVIGQLALMPSRDWDTDPTTVIVPHDLGTEFLDGLLCGDWYTGSRNAQYVNGHNFFARTVVFEVPGNALGGNGTALGNWRQGYWYARSLWGICKAANRFGRSIIEPSYGDETAAWLMKSGLR